MLNLDKELPGHLLPGQAIARCRPSNLGLSFYSLRESAKWVNKGGEIKNKPTVNPKVYAENSGKDRDKDGIAC